MSTPIWAGTVLLLALAYKIASLIKQLPSHSYLLKGILPPGPHLAAVAGSFAVNFAVAVIFIVVLDAAGLRLLRWMLGRRPAGPVRLTASLAGYALISLSLLGIACMGLFYPVVLAGTVMLFLAWARGYILSSLTAWISGIRARLGEPGGWLLAIALIPAVIFLAVPEVNMDCMQYHFSWPQQVALLHHMPMGQVFTYWNLPMPVELPYVLFLPFGLDSAIRIILLGLAFSAGTAFLRALPFRLAPPAEALTILAILLIHESGWIALTAKPDLASVAFGLGAFALMPGLFARRPAGPGGSATALLAGLLGGFAVAAKYTLLPFILLPAIAAMIINRGRMRDTRVHFKSSYTTVTPPLPDPHLPAGRSSPKGSSPHADLGRFAPSPPALRGGEGRVRRGIFELRSSLFLAGFTAPLLPWCLRTWIFTGDPLYPAGLLALPGLFASGGKASPILRELNASLGGAEGPAPLRTTLAAVASMAVVFLAGLPRIIATRRWRIAVFAGVSLAAIPALAFGVDSISWQVARFGWIVAVSLGLIGLAAVFGSGKDGESPDGMRSAVFGAVAALAGLIGIIFNYSDSYQKLVNPLAGLTGRISRADYLRDSMPVYSRILPAMREASRHLPFGSSIIEYGDSYTWQAPARVRHDAQGPHPIWQAVHESPSLERLEIRFRQMNARLLLFNPERAGFLAMRTEPYGWTPRMLRLYGDFASRHFSFIANSGMVHSYFGSYWLYGISSARRRPQTVERFLPGIDRAFEPLRTAMARGESLQAVRICYEMKLILPEFTDLDSRYWTALQASGSEGEAYQSLMREIDSGITVRMDLLSAYALSVRYGHRDVAARLLPRVLAWYPDQKETINWIKTAKNPGIEVTPFR